MRIVIANDHRGLKLKEKLKKYLIRKKYEIIDIGTNSKEMTDYPLFGQKAGELVSTNEADLGIVICGSGIGISIAANKVDGVRAAKVNNIDEAKLARKHNNANVLAIGGTTPTFRAKDIVDAFLKTEYVPLERFERRIEQIKDIEK